MNKRWIKKVSFISGLLLVVQSLTPGFFALHTVFAQDASSSSVQTSPTPTPTDTATPTPTTDPAPTPTVTVTPTPTATISPTPSDTATPTPTVEITPLVTPEATPTAISTETVTPAPIPTEISPTPTPSEPPHETSPPATSPTPTATPTAAPTPTPTIEVAPTPQGHISANILKDVKATSLNLDATNTTSATLSTDKADYAPTDTAVITGTGFLANHTYSLTISSTDAPATSTTVDVKTDANGTFIYAYQLDGTYRPNYKVEIKQGEHVIATTTFTDSASGISLDQYSNAGGSPGWQHGDLNSNNSIYREGDSVPFRLTMTGASGSNNVTIGWQTTNSPSMHAYDYLTTWNRTTNPDPCNGGACSGSSSTFSIPADTFTLQNSCGFTGSQISGNLTIWGGTITSVSAYGLTGCASTSTNTDNTITINFTATSSNVVITWAGHIASQKDWGIGHSASNIQGSPYHMLLDSCSFNCGAQDRALQANGVLPTPGLTTQISTTAITLGQSVTDTATYTEVSRNGTVSGTTQFYECAGNAPCTSTANPVGSAVTNTADHATSPSFTPLSTGTYCFAAYYTPDANAQYSPIDSTTTTNECVTVTNPPTGTLIVHKVTNPNTDTTTQFSITATGSGIITAPAMTTITGGSSHSYTVTAGTYSINEAALAGWSEDASNCQNVAVTAGGTSNCTITNTKLASVTVVKNTTGADGTFGFTTTGGLGTGSFNISTTNNSGTQVFTNVTPGTYGVSETVPTNWTLDSSNCTGANNTPSSFSVPAGGSVTCTFNDTAHGKLNIVKNTTGGDGTFNFTVTGPTPSTPSLTTVSGTKNTGNMTVTAGTYSLSETSQSGWTLISSSCSDGTNNNISPSSFAIGVGKTLTCTFNNTKLANIVINKVAQGGNGSFGFTTTGGLSPSTFTITTTSGAGSQSFNNILPGTYGVSEGTIPAGWVLSSATCNNSNDPSAITIHAGTTVICTFTNTKLPMLTVTKTVINHGLNYDTSHFAPYTVDSTTVILGQANTFGIGTHIVSENSDAHYTATFGGACDVQGNVPLAAGDNKTCTITNEENLVHLTLVKTVIKDNGGTANPTDWTLSASGPTSISGVTGDASVTNAIVNSGTYTLYESGGPSGYSASQWSCDGGSQTRNQLMLTSGQSVTCTITNDDIAPSLTLTKQVRIANGGTAVATDWILTATGPTTISGAGRVTSDATFKAGTYMLSESQGPSGYSAGAWTCDGGSQNGNQITLAVGDTASCSIANSDIAPQLTVVKHVITDNGGSAVAGNFTMNVTGTNVQPSANFPGSENGTTVTVNAGSYSVAETGPSGYQETDSTDCSGTIAVGEQKTCTITNDDIAPKLTVTKVVVNNAGSNGQVSDFPLFVGDTQVTSGTQNEFAADTYTVHETNQPGYSAIISGDCNVETGSVTLKPGDVKSCTITNTRDTGRLLVHKLADTDGDGKYDAVDPQTFTWGTANGSTTNVMGQGTTVQTGSYDIFENSVAGYQFVGWFPGNPEENRYSCTNLPESNTSLPTKQTVGKDQTTEITLCNKFIQPKLQISKFNNAGGDKAPGDNVLYTLTVKALDNTAYNVKVTDLLPDGFKYRSGSWTATLNGAPLAISEPTYASPGVWSIGTMNANDTVVLTLIADINSDVKPGLYKDIAWAYGCTTTAACTVSDTTSVLSDAVDPGKLGDNFVGTQVNLNTNTQNSAGVTIQHTAEGTVLGASTELPATGAKSLFVILASALFTGGLIITTVGFIVRRKYA